MIFKNNFWYKIQYLFFLLFWVSQAFTNGIVKIPQVENSPCIDGILNDTIWNRAWVCRDFKTIRPDFGLPPSEETELYLMYDSKNIYVGFRCFDKDPQNIKAAISKRDNPGNDDWVAFCLDTYNHELGCYFFMANPRGIQTDGTLNSEANPDITLDMIWESSGKMTDKGYSIEMAIPFASLRFPSRKRVTMGFKAARNISRKSEEVDFPEFHPERGAALAQFQKVELTGIRQKQLLEILPATTVNKKQQHQEGSMKFLKTRNDWSMTSKIGISSNLVVDATYNPDFSQIETDAGQIDVNLRHSLYYPERRPFFLEGQDQYAFAAQGEDLPLGAIVHTRNIVEPIVGLKLNGKIGKSNFISALYAQDEYPRNAEFDGVDTHRNPKNAQVGVVRYVRRWKNDSYMGGFYTGRECTDRYNHVFGTDGRLRLNGNSTIEYHGFGSWSQDQDKDSPYAGSIIGVLYEYNSRNLSGLVGLNNISKDFRTDIGYLTRRGITLIPLYLGYTFYLSSGWLQTISPYYWARHGKDHYSGIHESFNVFSLRLTMVRQTFLNIQGWLANEIFAGTRFNRNTFRLEASTQILKQIYLECDIRRGQLIYYDSSEPYQGKGNEAMMGIHLQPNGNLSSRFDITYSDFYRQEDGEKIFDYLIYRNRTVLQLNKYLFFRGVLEYNTYWNRLNADFLASFTYIPGTVLYLGYGSLYEKLQWQKNQYISSERYHQMKNNIFFKASYLWRF